MKSAFNNNRTYISGQPRNDLFFQENAKNIKRQLKISNNYIITYMPTHRKYGKGNQNPILFLNDKKVESFFNEINIKLLIKLHPNMPSEMEITNTSILNLTNLITDPQELLYISDILITDYSSCVVDYLLLNRPIIFYLYDDYEKVEENNLYFNLEDYCPGSIAKNESQLFSEINKAFYDKLYFLDKRQKILKLFNKYNDGSSSNRLFSLINNLHKY